MIELHGIVRYRHQGRIHTVLVVSDDPHAPHVRHELNVDVKVSRDTILDFLSEKLGVQRGDIAWPPYIKVPTDDSGPSHLP